MNAPPDSKKVPRGCAWAIVAMGGVLLVMGVLSFLAIPKLWKWSQEIWTETQGTIVESYLKEGERRSSSGSHTRSKTTTYDVRLKYRYAAEGGEYSDDQKALRQPEDDEKWAEAKAVQESYKAGEAIPVYYRPGDAERSRFTAKEATIEFKKDIFFVTVYLLGGWAFWALGRKMLR